MPLSAEKAFSYTALTDHDDIRFVILHPGAFSTPIQINISQTSLGRKRPYEALSYTWGDPKTLRPVAIRGQKRCSLYITENLEAALRHLRYTDKIRVLWVDALSVNQNDLRERSLQVMRMGDIFSRANHVCIWLGEAANHSDEAMDFIDQVSHLGKLDRLVKDELSVKHWHYLATLMRRAWFARRWIIQEVAFARRASLFCGMKCAKWSDFSDAVALFGDKFDEINMLFSPTHHQFDELGKRLSLGCVRGTAAHSLVTALHVIVRKAADGKVIQRLCTMEKLISSLVFLQATDPRDTIYAIMTLATDVKLSIVGQEPVDYTRSTLQVFKDFINHTINNTGTLDIICRPWAPNLEGLPSWATQVSRHPFDGDTNGSRVNADSLIGPPTRPIYNAKGKMPPAKAFWSDFGRGFTLLVRGFQFDRIISIDEPCHNGIIPSRWMEIAMRVAEGREQSTGYIPEWGYIPDQLWRTLVADRGENGNPAPGWYHRACKESYRRCDFKAYEYSDLDTSDLIENPLDDGNSSSMVNFLRRVQAVTWNRRMAETEESSIGIVPPETEVGDIVCVLAGCSVPVILRENEDDTVTLIGECYINGIEAVMDGQTAEEALRGKYEIMDFKLK